jgi:hypothetical protein
VTCAASVLNQRKGRRCVCAAQATSDLSAILAQRASSRRVQARHLARTAPREASLLQALRRAPQLVTFN